MDKGLAGQSTRALSSRLLIGRRRFSEAQSLGRVHRLGCLTLHAIASASMNDGSNLSRASDLCKRSRSQGKIYSSLLRSLAIEIQRGRGLVRPRLSSAVPVVLVSKLREVESSVSITRNSSGIANSPEITTCLTKAFAEGRKSFEDT